METPVVDRVLALQQRNQKVRRVLLAILVANWVVAAAKLVFGLLSQSASVTADGLHSFIDGGSNVLGLVAMGVASRPADEDHPYGHGKFEALASLGIGAMIGIGMLELGRMALDSLLHDKHPQVTATMAGVMVLTLVVNVAVTRVERHYGHKYKSSLLLADASHTLSDVWVTLAVLASLLLVWLGFPRADGLIALVVMVFVAWVAYGIVRQAVGILSDTARRALLPRRAQPRHGGERLRGPQNRGGPQPHHRAGPRGGGRGGDAPAVHLPAGGGRGGARGAGARLSRSARRRRPTLPRPWRARRSPPGAAPPA